MQHEQIIGLKMPTCGHHSNAIFTGLERYNRQELIEWSRWLYTLTAGS